MAQWIAPKHEVLNIQKMIALLDEFHYGKFIDFLQLNNADLSARLVRTIRQKLPAFHTHQELCKLVYGTADSAARSKFNQLNAHTFRLTGYLAVNYPLYLLPNINNIHRLINDGYVEEASFTANMLLQVTQKTGDFISQTTTLKFLTQQEFLLKHTRQALALNKLLVEAIENEKTVNDILYLLRSRFNLSYMKEKVNMKELEEVLKQLKGYRRHKCQSVSLISRYAHLYLLYYFKPVEFAADETLDEIVTLEADLQNNSYIVFPFLVDIKTNLFFLKLNSRFFDSATKDGEEQIAKLQKHVANVHYWNTYLNIPEMMIINIKASALITRYHGYLHRSDYTSHLREKDVKEIHRLLEKCDELLTRKIWDKQYLNDLINIKFMQSALTMLTGGGGIKKGVQQLEATLSEFQQINTGGLFDSLFVCLMVGYFAMGNHERCESTFRRYAKISKGRSVFEDNDIEIHTYYYLSQWLQKRTPASLKKLNKNIARAVGNDSYLPQQKSARLLAEQFNIPLEVNLPNG